MNILFLEYPKCSTCKKAKNWLNDQHFTFTDRHIVEKPPTVEELKKWVSLSDLPLKRFFNTSGNVYKELNLKEKLSDLSEEEQYLLLSSNGMLVKRPLLVLEKTVLVGFSPEKWSEQIPETTSLSDKQID